MSLPKRKKTVKPHVELHSGKVFSLKPIPKSQTSTRSLNEKVIENLDSESSTNPYDNPDSSVVSDATLDTFSTTGVEAPDQTSPNNSGAKFDSWWKVKPSLEVSNPSEKEKPKTPEEEWNSWKKVLESTESSSKKEPEVRSLFQSRSEYRGLDDSWDSWEESCSTSTDPESSLVCNIFDSHCHIDRIFNYWRKSVKTENPLKTLSQNFPEAFGHNFEGCITICCDPKLWKEYQWNWLSNEREVFLAFGCHPKFAHQFDEAAEEDLRHALQSHGQVVGLAELGLDFGGIASIEEQASVFKRQLIIAKELDLPVCLHLRLQGSWELLKQADKIMKEVLPSNYRLHMHCFTDDWETCVFWMRNWTAIKFGFVPDRYIRDVVQNLELDKILLETDSPYFVPKTIRYRYKFSVPGFVYQTAVQISEIKNVSVDRILLENRKNIETIYRIPVTNLSSKLRKD